MVAFDTKHVDNTLGAAFVGFAVASVFYGVLSTQVYAYSQRYAMDRPLYKAMVATIWLLETFHQILTGHTVYYYTISNYNNPISLLFPTWTVIVQVTIGALISVLVKSAYAIRVWRFSGNKLALTGLIGLLNCAILALALSFTIKAFRLGSFLNLPELKAVTTALLATSVLTDLIIAASLTYYLHHLRNAFSANTLINGLIRYSIETGAITSMCGIATLVAFDALPTTFVYMSFFFVLSKLYSNSLLATLNSRKSIRGKGTDRGTGNNGEFTIIQTANGNVRTTHSIFGQVDWTKQPTDLEVNVLHEIVSDRGFSDASKRYPPTQGSPITPDSMTRSAPVVRVAEGFGKAVDDRLREPERIARF